MSNLSPDDVGWQADRVIDDGFDFDARWDVAFADANLRLLDALVAP